MTTIIYRLLCTLLLVSVSSLASALDILACEPEWAALASAIAGTDARITIATGPRQDPHHVEARPALLSAVRRADVLVCTGADLEEGWLPVLLARGGNPSVQRPPGLFLAAEHVELIDRPAVVTRAAGHQHAAGNPHFHLDPRRLPDIADALARQLGELRPTEAEAFAARAQGFRARWREHIRQWAARAAPLRDQPVVVHHRSWNYLADWLGLRIVAELEPRPGVPPSPGHLAGLLEGVGNETPLILRAPFEDARPSQWLAQRTGSCALVLPFTAEAPTEAALVQLFDQLLKTLLEAREDCDA